MRHRELIIKSALISLLATWASVAWSAGEVQLLKARSAYTTYRNYVHQARFEALVTNLAYVKKVSIRLKNKDGSWTDHPLNYSRPGSLGKEVWSADFNNTLPAEIDTYEFAVKYEVNGQTYWDNNNSANYKIERNSGTVLYGPAVYDHYGQGYVYGDVYYGSVTLKNVAPNKSAEVVYTTDGWKTKRVAKAIFNANYWNDQYIWLNNPNNYGYEEWQYGLWLNSANQVEYAIKYTVGDKTYWDNNFGRNYVVRIQR